MWYKNLEYEKNAPATGEDIDTFLSSIFAPLSDDEIKELNEEYKQIVGFGHFDPPFDPKLWRFPKYPLPEAYLDFLKVSNGGFFEGKHRDLNPLFTTNEVRDYMLAYNLKFRTCHLSQLCEAVLILV